MTYFKKLLNLNLMKETSSSIFLASSQWSTNFFSLFSDCQFLPPIFRYPIKLWLWSGEVEGDLSLEHNRRNQPALACSSMRVTQFNTQISLCTFQEGFPSGSVVKNPPANVGFIPGSGRSPGEGNSNPLQYSCLGNLTDRGTWQAIIQRVTKSQTRLNN